VVEDAHHADQCRCDGVDGGRAVVVEQGLCVTGRQGEPSVVGIDVVVAGVENPRCGLLFEPLSGVAQVDASPIG